MNCRKVSVVCPIYNEERYIGKFIDSVLAQDYPSDKLEILLIDGMSTDGTRNLINRYAVENDNIIFADNPEKVVPNALNKGIRLSDGDVIVRLDAHCTYPVNYISRLVSQLDSLDADNVGGVWNTLPAKNTAECIAIAVASSHPFGVGASVHKIGSDRVRKVDTVPFGCYRRSVFERIGFFDEELVRNQDDEFNARLIKNGGSIYIIPDVIIDYTARESMGKMRKMYYQYGLFKPLVNKKIGLPASMRQFIPVIFVIGLVLGAVLSFFCEIVALIYMTVWLLYIIIGLYVGMKSYIEYRKLSLLWYLPYTFLNIHLSYGIGFLTGIYKLLLHKRINVKSNR